MNSLLQLMRHSVTCQSELLAQFARLTLPDLGAYVTDTIALQYNHDRSMPLEQHVFDLNQALRQSELHATSSPGLGGLDLISSSHCVASWKTSAKDVIGCATLFESRDATLCWFVIPPGRTLPLHDHPGMHVWQRVMYGTLHVCAIDWTTPTPDTTLANHELCVKLDQRRAVEGGEGRVVFSDLVHGDGGALGGVEALTHFSPRGGGVLHELTNVHPSQPALFADIICPPYHHAPDNIACTYFTACAKGTVPAQRVGECGVAPSVQRGDVVQVIPRTNYAGPTMNAYVRVAYNA